MTAILTTAAAQAVELAMMADAQMRGDVYRRSLELVTSHGDADPRLMGEGITSRLAEVHAMVRLHGTLGHLYGAEGLRAGQPVEERMSALLTYVLHRVALTPGREQRALTEVLAVLSGALEGLE